MVQEVLFSAEFIPSESPRTELTPTTVFTADTSRDGLMKELLSQLEEFRKTLKSVEENMKIQPSNESEAQDLLDVMVSPSFSSNVICDDDVLSHIKVLFHNQRCFFRFQNGNKGVTVSFTVFMIEIK